MKKKGKEQKEQKNWKEKKIDGFGSLAQFHVSPKIPCIQLGSTMRPYNQNAFQNYLILHILEPAQRNCVQLDSDQVVRSFVLSFGFRFCRFLMNIPLTKKNLILHTLFLMTKSDIHNVNYITVPRVMLECTITYTFFRCRM